MQSGAGQAMECSSILPSISARNGHPAFPDGQQVKIAANHGFLQLSYDHQDFPPYLLRSININGLIRFRSDGFGSRIEAGESHATLDA